MRLDTVGGETQTAEGEGAPAQLLSCMLLEEQMDLGGRKGRWFMEWGCGECEIALEGSGVRVRKTCDRQC